MPIALKIGRMDESDFKIDPKELRIDTFYSSGHGDERVAATDSAVRITHLPTNIVVSCNDEKNALKNRAKAMDLLRMKLSRRP